MVLSTQYPLQGRLQHRQGDYQKAEDTVPDIIWMVHVRKACFGESIPYLGHYNIVQGETAYIIKMS